MTVLIEKIAKIKKGTITTSVLLSMKKDGEYIILELDLGTYKVKAKQLVELIKYTMDGTYE